MGLSKNTSKNFWIFFFFDSYKDPSLNSRIGLVNKDIEIQETHLGHRLLLPYQMILLHLFDATIFFMDQTLLSMYYLP